MIHANLFPTSCALLDQYAWFRSQWWTRGLPPGWASALEQLPSGAGPSGKHQRATLPGYQVLTRRDLLDIGARGDVRAGLAAALAWNTGPRGHLVGRRTRFAGADPRETASRLEDAVAALHEAGPVEAFTVLNSGPGHVMYIGPALSSTFLYAMDSPGRWLCGRALILDGYMMLGLSGLPNWPYGPRTSITPAVYAAWLEWAADAAGVATLSAPAVQDEAVREDAVESAIYALGAHRAMVLNQAQNEAQPGSAPAQSHAA